jgi:hypothetical protein
VRVRDGSADGSRGDTVVHEYPAITDALAQLIEAISAYA